MFSRILVAVDSSEQSDAVVQSVQQIQLSPDAMIVLAHVIPVSEETLEQPADRPAPDPQVGQFRHFEQALQSYAARFTVETALEIVSGDPAEEIIRLSNIYRANLIVLGSRGLTGLNRILKGSVSSQVLTDAQCTVMVVKAQPLD